MDLLSHVDKAEPVDKLIKCKNTIGNIGRVVVSEEEKRTEQMPPSEIREENQKSIEFYSPFKTQKIKKQRKEKISQIEL